MKEITLIVNGGDSLKGLAWEIKKPVANVVVFEGMEEHASRYDEFAKLLNNNGINVYILDCYGQGLNVADDLSKRSIVSEGFFNKMVDAHFAMVEEAKKNGAKTYIYAHSMGSFMGQSIIQRHPGCVEKIILCGTGCKNPGIPLAILLGKKAGTGKKRNEKATLLNSLMFGNFNKIIKNPKTPYDWLTINEENVAKYVEDPLCGYGPTNGFCYEFLLGLNSLYTKKGLNSIDKSTDIFLISGAEDPVTNYGKATQKMFNLYTKLGIKKVNKKIYPNARHELHFEDCKEESIKDTIDFFLK